MKRGMMIAAALLAAACQPAPEKGSLGYGDEPPPVRVAESDPAADCAARGGVMTPQGRMQTLQCVVTYADAGKRCTDGDQCLGDCRADANLPPPPKGDAAPGQTPVAPTATEGRCQADSNPFGCYTRIENGRGTTICVD